MKFATFRVDVNKQLLVVAEGASERGTFIKAKGKSFKRLNKLNRISRRHTLNDLITVEVVINELKILQRE